MNQKARLGVVNINVIDAQLQTIITSLGLTPSQFPLFILYKSVISDGAANNINNLTAASLANTIPQPA